MGLFSGKSSEEKTVQKVAKALESMNVRPEDGLVHAGVFDLGLMNDAKAASAVLNGILEYLQQSDREIVSVTSGLSYGGDAGSLIYTILYR